MRPISRINNSIDCLRQRSTIRSLSPYACFACRHRVAFTTSLPRAAKIPFTEKLRKRIWGSDKPPGLKNPYGESGVYENKKKETSEEDTNQGTEDPTEYEEFQRPDFHPSQPRAFTGPFTEEDDVPGEYSPAQTWDGLDQIGGRKTTWNERWNFEGFLPAIKAMDEFQKTVALHRAVVEVYTLQQAKKPLYIPSERLSERELLDDITTDVQFVKTEAGGQLVYTEDQTQEKILQSLMPKTKPKRKSEGGKSLTTESVGDVAANSPSANPLEPNIIVSTNMTETQIAPTESEEGIAANRSNVDLLQEGEEQDDEYIDLEVSSMRTFMDDYHKNLIANWDPTWLYVSLENPKVKFAILKRTLQLTGVRIYDSQIASITDVKSLLARLVTPPKPRKLAKVLKQNIALEGLPNVTLSDKRIGMIDKETSVGRWKIIERELKRRELPIRSGRTTRRETL